MSHVTATGSPRISRRAALATVGTLSAALLLSACGGSSGGSASADPAASGAKLSGSVVFADFGGPTHERRAKIFLDPFAESTGVKVTSATIADAIQARMFDGGSGDYDVIQATVSDIYNHQANFVELPASNKGNDSLPADAQRYALGTFGVGEAQGWLTKTFPAGAGPTTWADFWDFTKFPGKRAIPGSAASFDYMFEAALLADGVAPADLYPLDLDRAIKKMDQLKGHVVFYTQYPQMQQLLASGSASIAFGPTGQYAALNAAGSPTTVNWNQGLLAWNTFVIPKGAPNQANALALADYFLDPKKQAEFATLTNYSPGNSDALQYVPAATLANLPTAPENKDKVIVADVKSRATSYDDSLAKYGAWLATAQK
jgi:putative spermidine/putrescine transport system substrate-binding protein